jgi:hypothetical protein
LEAFYDFNVGRRCGSPENYVYFVGPDWFKYNFVARSLFFVDSFDLHPSNQYILVRVISSCFHLVKMCLCQVSLLSRGSPRYLISSV